MHHPKLAAILLSTSLLAGGAAFAQTSDTAPAPTATTPTATAPAATTGKFVTAQGASEFKASKFVGIDVYGSENEKIGDISEILLDAQGNAKAVVIGVGGFLGIGQKNVAVPWSSVTWSNDPAPSKTASTERPAATGSTATGGTGSGTMGGGAARPPVSTPARSPAEQAAYNGYPDHAMVKLTKAELNDAPAFKYAADSASSTGSK